MGIVRDLYYARKMGAGLKLPAPSVALLIKRLALSKILSPAVLKTVTGALLHIMDALAKPAEELLVDLTAIQSGSGTPSPDNVRPISGRTGLSVYVSPTQDVDDATEYTADWTSPAGTVYSGSLDLVTGVLTVDKAFKSFAGTEDWMLANNAYFLTVIGPLNSIVNDSAICSHYLDNPNISTGNYQTGIRCFNRSTAPYNGAVFLVRPDAPLSMSLADFKTWLATENTNGTPLQVCYELATPLTYQLTAQEVELLLGENYLWRNDSGDLQLTYYADGNANTEDALNLLLGNRYVNNHTPEDVSDREALDILLGR